MSDSVTVETRVTRFDKIKQSLSNIGGGLLLIIACVVALYWNEGRYLQTANSLDEIKNVQTVKSATLDKENEGKAIHTQGEVRTTETLQDAEFGITAPAQTLSLTRTVEMYQWIEESETETKEDTVGGGETQKTTYTYKKGWEKEIQDSNSFQKKEGHTNPSTIPYKEETYTVTQASLGTFSLNPETIEMIGGETDLPINETTITGSLSSGKKIINNTIYSNPQGGVDPANPQVGDIRVSRSYTPATTISIIGKQKDNTIIGHQTNAGDAILLVENGTVSAKEMLANAKSANVFWLWAIRILGIIFLMIGFNMILSIITTIASVVGIFGWIVGAGVGLVANILGFLVGILTIAIAWLIVRPIIGLGLLAVVVACIAGLWWIKRQAKTG